MRVWVVDAVLRVFDRFRAPRELRSWNARRLGRSFDRRYGTDTQDVVDVSALAVQEEIGRHAVRYEPSTLPKIRRSLRHLGVRHEDFDFFDFGSGKGLVALVAARYPFHRVVGVEASAALCHIAERNLALYSAKVSLVAPVEFIHADALAFASAAAHQVIYLYNPFDAEVLRPLVARLLSTQSIREMVVAYVNPVHRGVFAETRAFETRFDDGTLLVLARKH